MDKNNKMPMVTHGNGNHGEATHAVRRSGKQDVNLRKRGFLRFQIGLILALLLVYAGLEASFRMQKEYAPPKIPLIEEQLVYEMDIPIIRVEKQQKEVLKVKSTALVEVDNDTEIEEGSDVIEVPVEGADDGTIPLDSIAYRDIGKEEDPTILINLVEEVPIFPGCEKVEVKMRLTCFKEKIARHVKRNFRFPDPAQRLGIQGRVNVMFKIGSDGTVTDIKMRGPSPILENEAERIIGKLPKMIPGKQGGKPVKVPYSLPILFQLN